MHASKLKAWDAYQAQIMYAQWTNWMICLQDVDD